MSFFLEHIERILQRYEGAPPLAAFLKQYYRQYPRLGSRDRRALTEAVYLYYRCRRFLPDALPFAEVIARAITWCGSGNAFLQKHIPASSSGAAPQTLEEFAALLSPSMPLEEWLHALWQQPALFIRIRRPGVKAALAAGGIAFETMPVPGNPDNDCLRLGSGIALENILPPQDYVVQDWASQGSIYLIKSKLENMPSAVWDVCSGAGGKSLLLKDKLPSFALLATDIRAGILHNLRTRFRLYNSGKVQTLVLDSTDAEQVRQQIGGRRFGLVVCDVPCSGSGTWARTPEQFHFFREEQLQRFRQLQYPIARNAAGYVAPGGTFAYITCSVFETENEAVVARLLQGHSLELVTQQLINGAPYRADCMFVAVFRKKGD